MFSKKTVKVGNLVLGGQNRVLVQSMLNLPSQDAKANVAQAKMLEGCGCDIIRVSVPNKESVKTVFALKQALKIPVVADIHFDYKLALESVAAGADKIRINPGNIAEKGQLRQIAKQCNQKGVPIRIGLNSGSIPQHILAQKGQTPLALVEAVLESVRWLNLLDFDNIVVSAKSSGVRQTIEANRAISQKLQYPIHLGVTEAGDEEMGLVKSCVGIGTLLAEGIGDTIRVALTAPPEKEVRAGLNILKVLGLKKGLDIVSCPTCGRTKVNLAKIAAEVKEKLKAAGLEECDLKISVMGCAVNGPGEAKYSDFGIACGDKEGLIFARGEVIKKVPEAELALELVKVIRSRVL